MRLRHALEASSGHTTVLVSFLCLLDLHVVSRDDRHSLHRTRVSNQQMRSARSKCYLPTTTAVRTTLRSRLWEAPTSRPCAAVVATTRTKTTSTHRCLRTVTYRIAKVTRSVGTMQSHSSPTQRESLSPNKTRGSTRFLRSRCAHVRVVARPLTLAPRFFSIDTRPGMLRASWRLWIN